MDNALHGITMVSPKSLWASKTFWINAFVGVLAIIGELQAVLPDFADILAFPPSVTRWLLFSAAIINIVLRRISDQPVRVSSTPEAVPLPKATPIEVSRTGTGGPPQGTGDGGPAPKLNT